MRLVPFLIRPFRKKCTIKQEPNMFPLFRVLDLQPALMISHRHALVRSVKEVSAHFQSKMTRLVTHRRLDNEISGLVISFLSNYYSPFRKLRIQCPNQEPLNCQRERASFEFGRVVSENENLWWLDCLFQSTIHATIYVGLMSEKAPVEYQGAVNLNYWLVFWDFYGGSYIFLGKFKLLTCFLKLCR